MTTAADKVRRWLRETGATQAELAGAVGLDETALSKCLNGRRRFTADEFSRIESHISAIRSAGFAEEQAAFERASGARAPIYRSRAAGPGEWIVDRPAGAIRHETPPARASGFMELYGFHAPDDAAWPRYKMKEIVWVSPAEPAGPGDDALIVAKSRNRTALRGVVGEIVAISASAITFRDFATRETRQVNAANVAVYCLISREK
jgi:hypothetical protein